MVLDYYVLVINLIYISIFLIATFFFLCELGISVRFETNYYLVSFNNIKINKYYLPSDFVKLSKKERKKYVFNESKNYTHAISKEQKNLVRSINHFRIIKGIPLLKVCYIRNLSDFIINELPEVMMFPE